MIIPAMDTPEGALKRQQFYTEVISKCEASRQARSSLYDNQRKEFLFGTSGISKVLYNSLLPHLQLVASFIFCSETTRFTVRWDPELGGTFNSKSKRMSEIAQDDWETSDADIIFGEAVLWSLVHGCYLLKGVYDDSNRVYPLSPALFSVLREDCESLEHQEAMVHTYYISQSELRRNLKSHPHKDTIMSMAVASTRQQVSTVPQPITRILLSQSYPIMTGQANLMIPPFPEYRATVAEELIEMKELWIWDDELRKGKGDYRVVTCADADVYIYDREASKLGVPEGGHPFVKVCSNPLPDYFWGRSELQDLIGVQHWFDERLRNFDDAIKKILSPSRIFLGVQGLTEEKALALNKQGGFFNAPANPAGKVQEYAPKLPEGFMEIFPFIRSLRNETSGVTPVLQGQGEEGVRSTGHAETLARMATTRPKKRAMLIERSAGDLATLMMNLRHAEDDTEYSDDDQKKFVLNQLPRKYSIKVSAHTSSPIFVEEQTQQLWQLFKEGVISKRTLVELLDPAQKEVILQRLKEIEESDAVVAKAKLEQEESKTQKNLRSIGK